MPGSSSQSAIRGGENYCPVCGAKLEATAINISEGVALCASCGQLSRLSEVVNCQRPVSEILANTPRGCSLEEWGQDVVVRASLRSLGTFVGALFVALFWNGIVSVFVMLAFAGVYTNLAGPLPDWFPAPDQKPMPLGMALFLCLFLTPFVAIGCLLIGAVLASAAGHVRVYIGATEATVATGVGFFNWRERFDPSRVQRVTIGQSSWKTNDQAQPCIVIEAERTIKFGTMLREDRRQWLWAVLQQLLTRPVEQRRETISTIGNSDDNRYRVP